MTLEVGMRDALSTVGGPRRNLAFDPGAVIFLVQHEHALVALEDRPREHAPAMVARLPPEAGLDARRCPVEVAENLRLGPRELAAEHVDGLELPHDEQRRSRRPEEGGYLEVEGS